VPPLCPTHLPDAQAYVSFLKGIYSSFYGMNVFIGITDTASLYIHGTSYSGLLCMLGVQA